MYYLRKTGLNKKGKSSKSKLVDRLDRVFALYIRLRDVQANGYGQCISCRKIKHFSELQCGHYISRKNMSTRFDETNCNAECCACNCFSADHLIGYRENLIRKVGQSRYDLLMAKSVQDGKLSDFEYEQLIKYYKKEVKRLSEEKGIPVRI